MRKAILMLASVLALTGLCAADSFTWTDTTSGVPGTVYKLETSPAGCTTSCGATLTITTNGLSGAYIGWIGFHLDSGNAASITSLSLPGWSVATGSGVSVPWGSNGAASYALPGTGGWSAIYANGLELPTGNFQANGISLSPAATYDTTFNFAWSGAGTLNAFPSLQVGYYVLDNKGGYKTTQMSQVASEPAAASFVALSLAALFAFRRRRLDNSKS